MQDSLFELGRGEEVEGMLVVGVGAALIATRWRRHAVLFFAARVTGSGRGRGGGGARLTGSGADRSVAGLCFVVSCLQQPHRLLGNAISWRIEFIKTRSSRK